METTDKKSCLECGRVLMGRADKKFCNDQCRNAYNNNANKESSNLIRKVNNRLRKNYKILNNFTYWCLRIISSWCRIWIPKWVCFRE